MLDAGPADQAFGVVGCRWIITLKNGAIDYVTKQRLDRLPRTVVRALAEAWAREDKRSSQQVLVLLSMAR